MATGIKRIVLVAGLALALLGSLGGMLRPHEAEAATITWHVPDMHLSGYQVTAYNRMNYTIKNSGNWDSGYFKVSIFDNHSGAHITTVSVHNLAPGASQTFWLYANNYCRTFKVVVDSANQVFESNESNNTSLMYGMCFG